MVVLLGDNRKSFAIVLIGLEEVWFWIQFLGKAEDIYPVILLSVSTALLKHAQL